MVCRPKIGLVWLGDTERMHQRKAFPAGTTLRVSQAFTMKIEHGIVDLHGE